MDNVVLSYSDAVHSIARMDKLESNHIKCMSIWAHGYNDIRRLQSIYLTLQPINQEQVLALNFDLLRSLLYSLKSFKYGSSHHKYFRSYEVNSYRLR